MSDSFDKPTFPDLDENKDVTSDIAEDDEGSDVEVGVGESDVDDSVVDVEDDIDGDDIEDEVGSDIDDDDEGTDIADDGINETESVDMGANEVKSLTPSSKKQMPILKLNSDTTDDVENLSSADDLTDTDTDDDLDDENALQKFDQDIQNDFIKMHHPEVIVDSHEKVKLMTRIKRNKEGIIDDPLHKTHPFMSRYEITHLLGLRAKQIEHGAPPLITVPSNIIDGYHIARLELQNKKIPFIIKRPLPGNKYEYWNAHDLEVLRDI